MLPSSQVDLSEHATAAGPAAAKRFDALRLADMLLHQGALAVFLAAAYSRDRQVQLSAPSMAFSALR